MDGIKLNYKYVRDEIMRLFLVRHGESYANVSKELHLKYPDHEIGLSPAGEQQAKVTGQKLVKYIIENFAFRSEINKSGFLKTEDDKIQIKENWRLWHSPYKRTRQTKDLIMKELEAKLWLGTTFEAREHLLLHEQKFGLFDGIADEDLPIRYPDEHAFFKKHEDFQGKFWARMPLGESRADVAQRVHQAFGTWHRDAERHKIDNLIIVAHGTVNRAITMMWLHKPYEWFEAEKNPGNCSIRLIENNVDKGYVFKGYKDNVINE